MFRIPLYCLCLLVLAMPNVLLADELRLYEILNAQRTVTTHSPLADIANFDSNGYCFAVQQIIARRSMGYLNRLLPCCPTGVPAQCPL
jgi:hypothetical protein